MNVKYRTPIINQYLYKKADRLNIPLGGTFEVTPFCNMSCKMCYIRQTSKERKKELLSVEEWRAIGEAAKENGLLYLLLTGGEPFSRNDFKDIYLELYKMGFVLTINSNGTMITEKEIEWLKLYPPMRINITLYGASNETYGKLCGNPKGFDQVIRAIHLLKEAGIEIKLNYSVTPDNAKDFHQIYEIAKKEELFVQTTAYMYPPLRRGRNFIGKNERFLPEDAAYYTALSHYYDYGTEEFIKGIDNLQVDSCIDESISELNKNDVGREHIRCRAGKSSFWVTWNGIMTPCGMMDYPTVDLKTVPFREAWEKLNAKTKMILMPAKCTSCPSKERCQTCVAMVLAENGNFDEIPKYRCRMMEYYPVACQTLKEQIINGKLEKEKQNATK